MTYRPPYSEGGGSTNYGQAKVQVNGNEVRILFRDNDGKLSEHNFNRADCPETIRPGTWAIALNGNKTKIYSIRPIEGVFMAHFYDIVREKGKPPVPQVHHGKSAEGRAFSYPFFRPIFEILEGDAKGLVIGYRYGLHYNIEEKVDEQGHQVAGYTTNPKYKNTAPLDEFMIATGVWDFGPIPFEVNILPVIWKRAKQADKKFQIIVKDSSVDSIIVSTVNDAVFGQ